MSLSGKCLCGKISYTCEGEPVFAGNCHCTACKKSSGSGSAPTIFFAAEHISIVGEATYFESMGASGQIVSRGFCPTCGSQLFGKPAVMPGMIAIRAGTLDDPSMYKPQVNIFTSCAESWEVMDDNLPQFLEMPPPQK